MMNQKDPEESIPILNHEEAIESSSRRHLSNFRSQLPEISSHDLEPGISTYRRRAEDPPPTVDDHNEENEHDTFLGQDLSNWRQRQTEENDIRREIEELELDESTSTMARSALGKRITSLSQRFNIQFKIPFSLKWKLQSPEGFRWPQINVNMCILFARCASILFVLAVLYVLFMSDLFTVGMQRMAGQVFDPESVKIHVQSLVDENQIRENLRLLTTTDHIAGTKGDYVLAQYLNEYFKKNSLDDVRMEEYGVYLNYPKKEGRKIEILKEDGSISWSAKIDEDPIYTNPPRQPIPVFHGHSKTGDVTGHLMYANYGSLDDFKLFHDRGIDTKGAIALVRQFGDQKDDALKIKAAELSGFAGCLIYSDPADDGFVKGQVAPTGRYMPEGGVHRGGVSLVSWTVGDVLTPGWASLPGAERIPKENNSALVNIPSLPISWGNARQLLSAIEGYGAASPQGWKGGIPNLEYWTGNLSSPKVRLLNDQDEVEQQPIWNVLGKINGVEQKEKSVIVGNHRDAWHYGAADPGSGTAVMMEVIRIFGDLVHRGWRPLRTIEFASWDGGEYNLIGSTEWVEDNMEKLRKDAYAYLNVGSAVSGSDFRVSGSPMFTKSLVEVLKRTSDPLKNKTMAQLWREHGGNLATLGVSSDYVAFQDMAGTSSLDIGFSGDSFPRNSAFDNFEWMDSVGDPGFVYHKILAQIWALLILEYADKLILPFDLSAYSSSLTQWVISLNQWSEYKGVNKDGNTKWDIEPLREAVLQFASDSRRFTKWEEEWNTVVYGGGGYETAIMAEHRKSHNNRMANFETHLLDLEEGGGIPSRTLFKHVLFGPQQWSLDSETIFPSIRDAVIAQDWDLAKKQVEKAANVIKKASRKLVGNT
ncbi:putative glutamate carboxypeptidase [Golovinomyces cichoracearum]|uniref:Putative glutamate carboxypeptidase n=1 Tax=Golovinomyces cichoracearum TaxID=62708 RepID=A0A420HBC4_9PEZI|nr:putative glutamate carboxypeptidase [Golovinomyces cichoracearum]